ncbi:hypothetical protein PLICRDRAFT_177065 [Plicaturopsis crispa FD-325 SS-3]|nr:hypothetical protein PLICRDRAFT_177065 [Plicaturopsis crispa FD-325 SS-3]
MDPSTMLLEPTSSVHLMTKSITTHGGDAHDAHDKVDGNAHNHKAHPCETTTKRDASRRLVVFAFPLRHRLPPPSARHRETTTTTRDASRRLVVFAFPLRHRLPPPSAHHRETTTTTRDASWRLVVVNLPTPPLSLATLSTPHAPAVSHAL